MLTEFIDRAPGEGMANKKLIVYEDGTSQTVTITNADEPVENGTPLNREILLSVQGVRNNIIKINSDGSITETTPSGEKLTTKIRSDGAIEENFEGVKSVTTVFRVTMDGAFTEVE